MNQKHKENKTKLEILAGFLVFSAFLPYFTKDPGIRYYNLFLYLAFAITFIRISVTGFNPRTKIITPIFLAVVSTLLSTSNEYINLEPSRVVASFERMLAWIVAMVIIIQGRLYNESVLKVIQKTYIVCLAVNGTIQIAQVFNQDLYDYTSAWFIDFEESVAFRALGNGRYLGVFNQPLELGSGLGVALIIMSRHKIFDNNTKNALVVLLLIVSGLLSGSKSFLLALIFYLFLSNAKLGGLLSLMIIPCAAWLILGNQTALLSLLDGTYLWSEISNWDGKNIIEIATASRFAGENKDVEDLFRIVTAKSPIIGLGYGSTMLLDNGILEFYYQGGIVAVVLLGVFLGMVIFELGKSKKSSIYKSIGFQLFLFSTINQVGVPMYTIWFIAIPLWATIISDFKLEDQAKPTREKKVLFLKKLNQVQNEKVLRCFRWVTKTQEA